MDSQIAKGIDAISQIDAIPLILKLCCQNTGLRFAVVARVTDTSWTACAVRDEINFGLGPGDELDLKSTICDEIRRSGEGVIIDHVDQDPLYRDHPTPRQYGFQSYISVPIRRSDGEIFGTLCALDPEPAKLANPATISMFEGFAQLIGLQLDAQERQAQSQTAIAEQADLGHSREQFMAILAHDLRNPLASVEAGIRMLTRADLPSRESGILGLMQVSCNRMNGLISDVLDFARGRLSKGMPVKLASGEDLGSALEHVIEELGAVHPERDIHQSIDLAASVDCDVRRVAQLLSNLLGNALAHGDPGEPVHVTALSNHDIFRLEVTNCGEPIPPAMFDTLFKPFTQRGDSLSHNGLGLGLYIAREIAAAHKGTIEVSSNVDETKFTVTFPSKNSAPAIPLDF